ncbi:MAG: hypothetical protein QOI11_3692 [Candidatus Eremiobacteraeota bacterium]|nr:hypothetical protein [Candidatus Eremiobacteraeota bacterium]
MVPGKHRSDPPRWERSAAATSAAPPAAVWRRLLDGRRWAEWNPGVQWMTVEGPLAPGTVVTLKPKGAPQTAFRIEGALEARYLALAVTFGPLATMRLRWELAPAGGGTALAQTVAIGGPLAGLLLRRTAERIAGGMAASLERLGALAADAAEN